MGIPAIQAQVWAAACLEEAPPQLAAQAAAVLARKLSLYARAPAWCVPELPRRTALCLGAAPDTADALAASAILYHCAADIVDDAQDAELAALVGWPGGGWEEAVTVGLYLLSAHATHLAGISAPAEVRAGWAHCFGRAGMVLTCGQHDDVRLHPDADVGEDEVLGLGARKAGGALAGLMCLGPIWAGRQDVPEWWRLGARLGQLFQLASDMEAYMGRGPHADLAAAKLTLPLLVARDADPALAELWHAGLPLDVARQEALRGRVGAVGALAYVSWRLEALRLEAEATVLGLGGEGLLEVLGPVIATARVAPEPVPI
ncbi:MAG: class 1 isoprenoid biosynthesis enzyme [Candidatus Sericytochromatia bacterium]|nr:class 1 isoprenoid biosynthesis enzyme [Candidatus Sericytochromatia bacterium]